MSADEPGASAEPAKVKVESEEQALVRELLLNWQRRLQTQASQFEAFTKTALQVDKDIATAVQEVEDYSTRQEKLSSVLSGNQGMRMVGEQQDGLLRLLSTLLEVIELRNSSREPCLWRSKNLEVQLAELEAQMQQLQEEVTNFHTSQYSEPLDQVGKALETYTQELDALQLRVDAANHRLRNSGFES